MESTKTYHILNLGAGVQSTALYLMFLGGEIDQALDYAVFADTQEEPEPVYRHLEWLCSLGGPPILTATVGKLGDDPDPRPGLDRRAVRLDPGVHVRHAGRHRGHAP